jgi:hypothetical protein
MSAFLAYIDGIARALLAVPAALLPRRRWNSIETLPVERAALVSGILTMVGGLYAGARGLYAYLNRAAEASIDATFNLAARQNRGETPGAPAITTSDLQALSVFSLVAFVLFTPLGLFSLYLVVSGAARAVSAWIDQPVGDPLLTGVDAAWSRTIRRVRTQRSEAARHHAEGPEVPDRLHTGEWAGLEGVDFVVVSSRRKPDWTRGTFVITSDKWYTLGEPFDLELPQGLRTVYPLTEQKVTEVLRRGVAYELPPLGRAPVRSRAVPRCDGG